MKWLEQSWQLLLSWRFDEPSHGVEGDEPALIRDFVAAWVNAYRDKARAHSDLAKNPVIKEIVDHLLKGNLEQISPRKREEAAEDLTREICEKLDVNAWVPEPTLSQRELLEQLLRFLDRKVDRGLTGRGAVRKTKKTRAADDTLSTNWSDPASESDLIWATESIDVAEVLKQVKDDKERLAFQLHLEGLPYTSKTSRSIAGELNMSGHEAQDLVKKVSKQLASTPAVLEMLSARARSPGSSTRRK